MSDQTHLCVQRGKWWRHGLALTSARNFSINWAKPTIYILFGVFNSVPFMDMVLLNGCISSSYHRRRIPRKRRMLSRDATIAISSSAGELGKTALSRQQLAQLPKA